MKISVSDEKKLVEDQRRQLEEQIADFQRRKAQYEVKKKSNFTKFLLHNKLNYFYFILFYFRLKK